MKRFQQLAATCVALGLLLFAPSAFAGDLAQVLEQVRKASGYTTWAASGEQLTLSGTAQFRGVQSSLEQTFAPDGSYRHVLDGPFSSTVTWNGSKGLFQERRGPVQALRGEELGESSLAYWVHCGYWAAEDAPLTRVLKSETDDTVVLTVGVTGTMVQADLSLDRATWLPTEMVRESAGGSVLHTFGEYETTGGITIARKVMDTLAGVEGRFAVSGVTLRKAESTGIFNQKAGLAKDTSFLADVPAVIESKQVPSGHILVHPLVGGEDKGWFILDSGAGQSCIDPKVADSLGMPKFGEVPAVGIGGTVVASFRQGKLFELGCVQIEDTVYVELDLSFLEAHFGVPIAGICGFDLFARSVVELDLEELRVAIHDPATYKLQAGEWGKLHLDGRLPCITAKFEGDREGVFKIDTGDAGTVNFYGHAVKSMSLLKDREVVSANAGGVGGYVPVKRGELKWFEIGGQRFDAIEASFALKDKGAFGDDSVMGSIGGKLLKPFRVVFDYPFERIALVKSPKAVE